MSLVGKYLRNALQHHTDSAGAPKIAALVQPYRTKIYDIFEVLVKNYVNDPSKFGDLGTWFEQFHFDVDGVGPSGYADTFGTMYHDALADRVTSADDKVSYRSVLELARPYSAKEMKEFRDLFKKYEQDATTFADLKKWFDEHPFDIDKVVYEPADAKGETFGQRVNVLNATNLRELFKVKRSNPDVSVFRSPKLGSSDGSVEKSWVIPKKMICAALGVVAILYYYSLKNTKPQEIVAKDPPPVLAAS